MDGWCLLTFEKDISLFFFDKHIITSNLFLDMIENYFLPQLNNKNNTFILQLDGVPVHLLTLSMTVLT
jgi:hypothetical protein